MVPPYVPWRTFETYIDGLKALGPQLPNVIDRDSMRTFSGATQSQILSSLRWLDAIDDGGVPKQWLKQVVHAGSAQERKHLYDQIVKSRYSFLNGINLQGATPKQIETAFEAAGASGDTVRKSISFFIGLAKAAGVPLSPLIEKTRRRPTNGGAKPKKRAATPVSYRVSAQPQYQADQQKPAAAMKTVALPIAKGELTLSGTFSLFDLTGDERELVFAIIDKMKAFEAARDEEQP
jgi:hypothetical protein